MPHRLRETYQRLGERVRWPGRGIGVDELAKRGYPGCAGLRDDFNSAYYLRLLQAWTQ